MLKKVLFVVFVMSVGFTYAQKINWVSFNEALELQKETPKKIIMDVYTNWCGPCKMLDRNTFQNSLIHRVFGKLPCYSLPFTKT